MKAEPFTEYAMRLRGKMSREFHEIESRKVISIAGVYGPNNIPKETINKLVKCPKERFFREAVQRYGAASMTFPVCAELLFKPPDFLDGLPSFEGD